MGDDDAVGRPGELWIEQRQLVDQVVEKLRDAITRGHFRPGQVVRQAALAEQMGVSRTPLRMALSILTSQGLLQRNGSRGYVVPGYSYDGAIDLYRLREMVLAYVCRLAAERITDAQLAELGDVVDEAEEFVEARDWPGWLQANELFGACVARSTGVLLLEQFLETIGTQARVFQPTLLASADDARERLTGAAREHRAIYEAIRDRDPKAAERAARTHVANSRKRFEATHRASTRDTRDAGTAGGEAR
ncbi:MAG: FCD domain-containing protein [Actinophytocola sp.]|uniref:GntR family transcriptional regulator n=1 Tax=Actinophytocola sp. TaxID=1872138 RepID=UPI0013234845|nr:GntR family transcriptional regulator [Actinophytocola sp.]MPZ82985.1 FCD domain-containing protein [Actinophytocola sp.]